MKVLLAEYANPVGPGRYCSPRRRMPFNLRNEGLQSVG
jgi:hypothetical protein